MKPNILITVCGRGGSKGIPGKNVKPVGGRPLLAYTADTARKFADLHGCDVIVSTDSDEIRRVAADCGLPTDYVRPDYLANDTCGKPEAIKDAMLWAEKANGKRYDYVIDLDVTSPIRTIADIEACLAKIEADPEALTIFSVNPCGRNPYFCQVEQKDGGYYSVVCGNVKFKSRQSSPKVYDMNGSIYVYRREALDCDDPRAITPRSLIHEMDHLCFDLDEPQDFDYLSYLFDTGKISFDRGTLLYK